MIGRTKAGGDSDADKATQPIDAANTNLQLSNCSGNLPILVPTSIYLSGRGRDAIAMDGLDCDGFEVTL